MRSRESESARSSAAATLQDLIDAGPPVEAARALEGVLRIEKRSSSMTALIPVFGFLAIRRSEVHGPLQKLLLTAVSLAVTIGTGWALWVLLPDGTEEGAKAHRRVREEMAVLGEIANRVHTESGRYPDAATWRRNADHADGRYFDPWGRPYLYESDRDRITLRTLGRDGTPGGRGDAADLSATFSPGVSPLGATQSTG